MGQANCRRWIDDILPTGWQGVQYADIPPGGSVAVWGLGPVGQMAARIARHLGAETVIGLDRVPERLEMARRNNIDTLNFDEVDDIPAALRELTGGRGPDSAIDAVGMEAHDSKMADVAQRMTGMLPDPLARKAAETMGIDRLVVLKQAIESVRRGGTVSISGVYGGQADALPLMTLFDKQITLKMGQANCRRWIDDILPLLTGDDDPLGVLDMVTHRVPLDEAPHMYEIFQKKEDGCIKVVLQP